MAGLAFWANSLAPSVAALAGDGDPAIRAEALRTLALFRSEAIRDDVVQRLPAWLADANTEVAHAAANLVGLLAGRACNNGVMIGLKALIEDTKLVFENRMHYRAARSDVVRTAAIRAFGSLGPGAFEAAFGAVLNLVLDPDIETAIAAAQAAFAMGTTGQARLLDLLVAIAE